MRKPSHPRNKPFGRASKPPQYALDLLSKALLEKHKPFCLVLGAGASADLGAPQWFDLIEQAANTLATAENPLASACHPILSPKDDGPWMFELLETLDQEETAGAPSVPQRGNKPVWRSVSSQFYDSLPMTPPFEWPNAIGFRDKNLHFLAIMAIINAFHNPLQQFHVMTYNLDTLLEEKISALGHEARSFTRIDQRTSKPAYSIIWKRENRSPNVSCSPLYPKDHHVVVNVFHPHGLLLRPEKAERINSGDELYPEMVREPRRPAYYSFLHEAVMSSEDYDRLANSPVGESNTDQLRAFANYHCLFYGFSFTDPNVRRLTRLIQILNLPLPRGVQRSAEGVFQHIILMRAQNPDSLGFSRNVGSGPTKEDLLQQRLAHFRILRLGHHSFAQQKTFLTDLLHRINRPPLVFDWPV